MNAAERPNDTTCWVEIRQAARGSEAARAAFAARYHAVVLAYLRARWRLSPLIAEAEDAVQDVLFECLKEGGALERAEERRAGGFRAFLHGVTRHVAARHEERRRPVLEVTSSLAEDLSGLQEEDPDRAFERSWAETVLDYAGALFRERARILGEAAERRVEILRLRFEEDLPIREIAARLEVRAELVHKHYALAREEFEAALREAVAYHEGGDVTDLERECAALLAKL